MDRRLDQRTDGQTFIERCVDASNKEREKGMKEEEELVEDQVGEERAV